jgi:hypothetical protein
MGIEERTAAVQPGSVNAFLRRSTREIWDEKL